MTMTAIMVPRIAAKIAVPIANRQMAAQRDQPRACLNLGVLYATGQMPGIKIDFKESVRWYKRAADLGVGRAAAVLGGMALRGNGMSKDAAVAEAYFKRAEELGFDVDEYLQSIGLQRKL
jgi:TPR repeat protein